MKAVLYGVLITSIGMAALAARTSASQTSASDRIDKKITRKIDLTRDGKPEKIVLHVTGKDIHSPFTWTIEVYSIRHRIFYFAKTDPDKFDDIFSVPSIFDDCGSPESCKLKWYFADIMRLFLYPLGQEYLNWMEDRDFNPLKTFGEIRDLILKTGKASVAQANKIVEDLKQDIKNGKAICIRSDVNPFIGGPLLLWIPIIDDFIEIKGYV